MRTNLNLDAQACLSQNDFISGLQAHSTGTGRNGNSLAVSNDARSMRTSVVIQTVLRRHFCAVDVSVVSGHAWVRLSSILGESHVVRPDQAIVTVANFGTPAKVYTRSGEYVDGFIGYSSGNGQFQTARNGLNWR